MDVRARAQVTDVEDVNFPPSPSTDVARLPGGALAFADTRNQVLSIVRPSDPTLEGHRNPTVIDVLPDRGPRVVPVASGGIAFVLGGAHFDAIPAGAAVRVAFGGAAATDVTVGGPSWIKGKLPSRPAGGCPVDVTLMWADETRTLPRAFCFLPPARTAAARH